MFKRILVPLDASAEGEAVLSQALRIASTSTEIVLLHVLPAATPAVGAPPTETLVHEERAREYLEEVAGRLDRRGTNILIRAGDPVEEILAASQIVRADAIAMATHGRRGLSRLLAGSVAEQVLRKSPRPVLFTGPESGRSKDQLRRILLAMEAPDRPARAFEAVQRLASESGAEIILLQTVAPGLLLQPIAGGMPLLPFPNPSRTDRRLERLAGRLRAKGFKVRTAVVHGYAAAEIVDQAMALEVDLVVMDRESRRGLDRLISTPVSRNLLRLLNRPLLLYPRAAA